MSILKHNGKYYTTERHFLPIIGDLFLTPQGNVVESNSLSHLEVLTDIGAELLVPLNKSSVPSEQARIMKNFPVANLKDTLRQLAFSH